VSQIIASSLSYLHPELRIRLTSSVDATHPTCIVHRRKLRNQKLHILERDANRKSSAHSPRTHHQLLGRSR
jgi:hypothetical protein